MNAITVNYAEVGEDHIPVSFGFVRNSDLIGQTVYNSTITKINDTYSILQGRDIGTKDIIVSSDSKDDRLLSSFTSGTTSWIQHRIPESDKTTYIFYNSDGYYYKMVESADGKPVQEKYAPYACLTNVKDNAGSQPYCEAEIETPVVLNIADGKIKAIIDSGPVEIANTNAELTVQLENADDEDFTSQTISEPEYTIGDYFSLDDIVWTRDSNSVSAWLLDNKIVKSSDVVKGRVHQVKMLAGNNIVKIFRKRSKITVNFTFTNPNVPSFEDGGASSNEAEGSSMSDNSLIIPQVKHGRSQINLVDFFDNAQKSWFKPSAIIDNLLSATTFYISVNIPTPTDILIFTGWLNDRLVQENQIEITHKRLPQTIIVSGINTENLDNITVEDNGGLLIYMDSNNFKRDGDFSSKTFTATAHYTDIPYTVDGDKDGKGTHDQVVIFKGKNYVYDDNIQSLVQSLTSREDIVSLKGKNTVEYPDPSQPVDVTVTVNFSATKPDSTKISFTAEIKLTVQNFNITKSSVDSITENGSSIKDGTILTYEKNCVANEDETGFTCTVTVTKLTKKDNTSYNFSNNNSGTKTGTVTTGSKEIFN